MKRRTGYSLVEMLVVMATGSIILGLSVGLVGLAMRNGHVGSDHLRRCTVLARLAEQFCDDVHAASAVDPVDNAPDDPDGSGWRFTVQRIRTIEYRRTAGELTRVEHFGQEIRRRDYFALPEDADVEVEIGKTSTSHMVSMVITTSTATGSGKSKKKQSKKLVLQVDAVLGRDHRFEAAEDVVGQQHEE